MMQKKKTSSTEMGTTDHEPEIDPLLVDVSLTPIGFRIENVAAENRKIIQRKSKTVNLLGYTALLLVSFSIISLWASQWIGFIGVLLFSIVILIISYLTTRRSYRIMDNDESIGKSIKTALDKHIKAVEETTLKEKLALLPDVSLIKSHYHRYPLDKKKLNDALEKLLSTHIRRGGIPLGTSNVNASWDWDKEIRKMLSDLRPTEDQSATDVESTETEVSPPATVTSVWEEASVIHQEVLAKYTEFVHDLYAVFERPLLNDVTVSSTEKFYEALAHADERKNVLNPTMSDASEYLDAAKTLRSTWNHADSYARKVGVHTLPQEEQDTLKTVQKCISRAMDPAVLDYERGVSLEKAKTLLKSLEGRSAAYSGVSMRMSTALELHIPDYRALEGSG